MHKPGTLSDTALAARLADGAPWAMDEIYRRYAPLLRRYARRFVEDALAEDMVHDALTRTQVALHGRGRDVELRPWLYRCVRNACLSELDRAGRRCAAELPDDRFAAGGADAFDAVAGRQEMRATLAGISALPERQRDALVLRAFDGAGYDQLAARFGTTENATVQLVHRARRNLEAALAA